MKYLLNAIFLVTFIFLAAQANASADKKAFKDKISQTVDKYEKYKSKIAEFESSEDYKKEILTENQEFEVAVGDPDAPIKIVEYLSLTCSHCKEFHEKAYYKIKKEYIDEGKVYMKLRHFPLNGAAVKSVLVLDCVAEENKQAFIGALLKSQAQWAYVKTEAQLIDRLKTVSKIGGLNDEQFQTCYADTKKQDKLLELMKTAAEGLMIDSTPALYVDGTRYLGSRDFEGLKKIFDEKLANPKTSVAAKTKEVVEKIKEAATEAKQAVESKIDAVAKKAEEKIKEKTAE